jgi:hypothetical protein
MDAARMAMRPLFSEALDSSMVPQSVAEDVLAERWKAEPADLVSASPRAQRRREEQGLTNEQRILSPARVEALTFDLVDGVAISVIEFNGALRIDSEGLRNMLDYSLVKAGYPNINTNTDSMVTVWREIREAHQAERNGQGKSQDVMLSRKSYFPFGQGKKMFDEFMRHREVLTELGRKYPETGRNALKSVTTIAEGLMNSVSRRIMDLSDLSKKPDLR